MAPDPTGAEATGAMVDPTPDYTLSGNFSQNGNSFSVSIDLSGLGDITTGNDEVDVYSAAGTNPTSRLTTATDRRVNWTTGTFPSSADGGAWTRNGNFWVQLDCKSTTGTWTTYQGNVTSVAGTMNIDLYVQSF